MTAQPELGTADRVRDLVDELASVVAADDPVVYAQVAVGLLNVAGEVADQPGERRAELALRQLGRQRRRARSVTPAGPDLGETIWSDETFVRNMKELMRDRKRIVGGQPTTEFPDCVAVGAATRWCCSGTLIAPNVVVTAAHCPGGDCADRVLVGTDTDPEGSGRIIQVQKVHVHPDYRRGGTSDVAALVLQEDVDDIAPRPLAAKDAVDAATTIRLTGFGNVDVFASHGYGVKRTVDVPVASPDPRFGADPQLEFVAGAPFLDRDSCTGDSGGPAYVDVDGKWLLAGATSRATASSVRPCGDGGIYGRMHAFEDWLRAIPDARFDA
jgi:secreted trypsin-like serine protease